MSIGARVMAKEQLTSGLLVHVALLHLRIANSLPHVRRIPVDRLILHRTSHSVPLIHRLSLQVPCNSLVMVSSKRYDFNTYEPSGNLYTRRSRCVQLQRLIVALFLAVDQLDDVPCSKLSLVIYVSSEPVMHNHVGHLPAGRQCAQL